MNNSESDFPQHPQAIRLNKPTLSKLPISNKIAFNEFLSFISFNFFVFFIIPLSTFSLQFIITSTNCLIPYIANQPTLLLLQDLALHSLVQAAKQII